MFQKVLSSRARLSLLFSLAIAGLASAQGQNENIVPMPDLPVAEDMDDAPRVMLQSADPKPMDLYGSCLDAYVHEGRSYLLVGQSRGVDVRVLDDGGEWLPHQFIAPPESCGNAGTFGTRFALDGEHLALRPTVLGDAGLVHVFKLTGDRWAHHQDIGVAQHGGERLGLKVTVGSGWMAVFGRGDVSLFRLDESGRYVFSQKVKSPGTAEFDRQRFGRMVHVSGDEMIVSSYRAKGANECVDIYRKDGSDRWNHVQHLEPPHGLFGTWFGHHVRLGDGLMAISSPRWKENRGRVDIYKRAGGGLWEPSQTLDVFPDSLSSFGTRFQMGDGLMLVQSSTPRVPGSAYLFALEDEAYRRMAMYGLTGPEAVSSSFAADAVVLPDRKSLIISAPGRTVDGVQRAGSANVYALPQWSEGIDGARSE